jgi:uncharacterized membrane protein
MHTMLYSTLFHPSFWQCSCRSVTGSLPVQDAGATNVFGLGGGCAAAGSFGGVAVAFGFPFCFVLTGGGSGSGGFWGFGSFGVFFAIAERVQELRKKIPKFLCLVDRA